MPISVFESRGTEKKRGTMRIKRFPAAVTGKCAPGSKTLQELFEERASLTPDKIVLVFEDSHFTYGMINRLANQLARIFTNKGIKQGSVVGLLTGFQAGSLAGLLGILKAGGACLSLPPGLPGHRLAAILADGPPALWLTGSSGSEQGRGETPSRTAKPGLTASRPQILDLDSLPMINRSLVSYEKYHRHISGTMAKHTLSLIGTRGCPYHCSYCHKLWPKKQVQRSAEQIFREIRCHWDLGIRKFSFLDDTFNLDEENSSQVFRELIKNCPGIQLFFPNGVRGDRLNFDYIDLMMEAGTVNVMMALETASPRLQRLIGRNLRVDKFKENIRYIIEKYPQVILELNMITGFPTETREEALATLELLKELQWVHFPNLHILKIYPNTGMYKLALENGVPAESIHRSSGLAYHELPDTLPFSKNFVLHFQSRFLEEYFLLKKRFLAVLPFQMRLLTEEEIVRKYDSYLPADIKTFADLLAVFGISGDRIDRSRCLPESYGAVPSIDEKMRRHFPGNPAQPGALRVLLLDLSQFFSNETDMLYDVVEPPLGLMSLLTFLEQQWGGKIEGKIAKSRIDFDDFSQLKTLVEEFGPGVIGIRTLSFYKRFFHQAVRKIRQWGFKGIIVAGGPYATSDYESVLADEKVDLAVIGEGEITFSQLIEAIMAHQGKLPGKAILEKIPGLAIRVKDNEESPGFQGEKMELDKIIHLLVSREIASLFSSGIGDNTARCQDPSDLAWIVTGKENHNQSSLWGLSHAEMTGMLEEKVELEAGGDMKTKLCSLLLPEDVEFLEMLRTILAGEPFIA
jgi:radical SAM superfamily enzyme YgiQ (UPF0313 family)